MDNIYLYLRKAALSDNGIIDSGTLYKYREILEITEKYASYLKDSGFNKDNKVGIYLDNSIEYIITLFALHKLGIKPILYKKDALSYELDPYLIQNSISEYIICEKRNFKFINADVKKIEVLNFNDMETLVIEKSLADEKFDQDESIFIQHTSGTTGVSKFACRTLLNVSNDIECLTSILDYKQDDYVYCTVPISHGYGLTMGLLASIKAKSNLVIEKFYLNSRFIKTNDAYPLTILLGTPEIFQSLNSYIKNSSLTFEKFKWIFSSGSAIDYSVIEAFYKSTNKVISQVYGMMEISTIAINTQPTLGNCMSVGKIFGRLEMNFSKTTNGDYKNILIRGDNVSKYYYVNGKFIYTLDQDGWFNTKDLATIDYDGNIFLEERKL